MYWVLSEFADEACIWSLIFHAGKIKTGLSHSKCFCVYWGIDVSAKCCCLQSVWILKSRHYLRVLCLVRTITKQEKIMTSLSDRPVRFDQICYTWSYESTISYKTDTEKIVFIQFNYLATTRLWYFYFFNNEIVSKLKWKSVVKTF